MTHDARQESTINDMSYWGCRKKDSFCIKFVIIWDSLKKQSQQVHTLNERKIYLVVETCNGKVSSIVGVNDNLDHLDTVECIDVATLLANMVSRNHHQKSVSSCLSVVKIVILAVVVHNWYKVHVGGYHTSKGYVRELDLAMCFPIFEW